MGRGLFYLIAGAVVAWSLYSRFADSDRDSEPAPPPRSRPRSPSPSRRRDARQTAYSRVNHPPVNSFHPRPPSPTPFDDHDSSRVEYPPAQTYASLNQPRSPPHIPSRRCDDQQADNTPVKTLCPQSPSPSSRRDAWQTATSRLDHLTVGTSIGPPPHTPSRWHDDLQANDPQVGTSTPFGQPPHISGRQCGRRIDDRGTIDSPQAEFPPAKAPASISHSRSSDRRHNNQRANNPPVETPIFIYTVDGWKTLESSRVEEPLVKAHLSLSHPRPPSLHIPRSQPDDQQTPESESEEDYPLLETSVSLREMAKQEGDLRSKCYQKSQKAHKHGLHTLAQAYSTEAEVHACKRKSLNTRASAMVFKENNKDRPLGEIDLHGLYVKEAISYANMALREARQRGDSEICLIVGRGNHSDGGIARLKPAIKSAMRKCKVRVHEDPNNAGRLRLVIQG